MNKLELIKYLKNFNIEDNKINKFLDSKKIILKNSNIFLVKKDFIENQVYGEILLFIKLKQLLPSKFLLEFIIENTKNIINISNQKNILNFTYSKSIEIKIENIVFEENKNYILLFENEIIGFGDLKKIDKKIILKNKFNIGQYLKEN